MKNNQKNTLIIMGCTGPVIIALIFFLLIVFLGGLPLESAVTRLTIPLALYTLICIALTSAKGKLFDDEQFTKSDGEAYARALKKLGAAPLKTLIHITFCSLVFLIIMVCIMGEQIGIAAFMKIPLFLLGFAVSLLGAAFMYVFTDRLVSKALLENRLILFPRDLRENRQSIKVFIIPMAIAVISMIFSLGITITSIIRSGKPAAEMDFPGDWLLFFMLTIPFFLFTLCLAATIKKNTAMLYSSVIAQLENLSSAKKDLTRRIFICSVDEVGTISGMVNDFTQNIEKGIGAIKNSRKTLNSTGVSLKQEAVAMADSISRISGGIEQIHKQSESQSRSVDGSSAAVEEIARNIETLDNSITRQGSSVSQASAAVEEMVGNINSIGSMVDRMLNQFKQVSAAAEDGSQIQKESSQRVQEIVAESEALQEANRIIATIAAQTNLLAMNAAIEAAHAGDAGRGFAVVADEIRKLAENSSRESAKISAELKQISETINNIVKGAAASTQAFAQVSAQVGDTEKLVYEVNNAVKEQQEGADQVLASLRSMNDITSEVSIGSKEMRKGNETMLSEMSKLQDSSRQISGSIDEMAAGISRINTGAQTVSNMAEDNQSAINDISAVADEFET